MYSHTEAVELGPTCGAGTTFSRARAAGLGVPIGHVEFVRTWAETRVQEERILLEHLPQLPDLQCAWLLLALCATPRANHALRTVPPPEVAPYAQLHDAAVGRHLAAGSDGCASHRPAAGSSRGLGAVVPASHGICRDVRSPAGRGGGRGAELEARSRRAFLTPR